MSLLEWVSDTHAVFTFHQSWINEYLMCEYRSLAKANALVVDSDTDATILGTAFHYGIEVDLRDDHEDPYGEATRLFMLLATTTNVRWVKNDMAECRQMLQAMWTAWSRSSLRKKLKGKDGQHHELQFDLVFDEFQIRMLRGSLIPDLCDVTVTVKLAGMIDYIDPPVIYDWKTAGQAYKQWEKQRWAIQPTVYSWAAVQLGLATYPVDFRFATFSKKKTTSELEIIEVTRDQEHASWLRDMLRPIVMRLLKEPAATEWVRNDQHALCSSKYCPAWQQCKGAHINPNTW